MDVILALVDFLKAQSSISAGPPFGVATDADGNLAVYDFSFPEDLTLSPTEPQNSVVVLPHGGPQKFAQLYLNETRVSIRCYGPTDHLAYVVYNTVYQALKYMTSSVWAQTNLKTAIPAAGPIGPQRDVQLQWAYNLSSWLVTASDQTVT